MAKVLIWGEAHNTKRYKDLQDWVSLTQGSESCCGPGRLMLNPLESVCWLQIDLVQVRSETSLKQVSDRMWAKSICDRKTDSSGFSSRRPGHSKTLQVSTASTTSSCPRMVTEYLS